MFIESYLGLNVVESFETFTLKVIINYFFDF